MSRRVEIVLTCDACQAWKDAEVSAGVVTTNVSAGQTLDLCPEHVLALARVWALVAEWGASPEPVRRPRRAATSAATPAEVVPAEAAEGNGAGTAATAPKNRRGGKRARARREGATGAATAAPGSFACPLCDANPASMHAVTLHLRAAHNMTGGEVYGGTCPVCNHAGKAGGLGVHARMAHGVTTGVPGLFALAESQGDPHGVIASRAQVVGQAAHA